MQFHFFHNWNKWVIQDTYEIRIMKHNITSYELVTVQSRTCQICGYTQIKTITTKL